MILLVQPVRKFFRAGCLFFYSLFSLECFFLECFKRSPHFFQPVSREARCSFCFVDLVTPILALIFVKQIVVVFSCSLIEFPFILEGLLFPAFVAAQFIAQTLGEKNFAADFALAEVQSPVRKKRRNAEKSWLLQSG